jgi:uncharacterized membrane protein YoaK (UPF0700 family)
MYTIDAPRRRHALVVILTFVTGSADAIGFLALGAAFSSVMTGNMVLFGLSGAAANLTQFIQVGLAIVFFILGVIVGTHLVGKRRPGDGLWPRRVTVALAVEAVLYIAFVVLWEITLDGRSDVMQHVLLGISALALGIQSSAVQGFGVPGLSSTYLTGTLTTMVGGFASRKPFSHQLPQLLTLLALIVGAAAGYTAATRLPWAAPLLTLLPLVGVVVVARLSRWPAGDAEAPVVAATAPADSRR